jgi:hypothetical protein
MVLSRSKERLQIRDSAKTRSDETLRKYCFYVVKLMYRLVEGIWIERKQNAGVWETQIFDWLEGSLQIHMPGLGECTLLVICFHGPSNCSSE